MNKPNPLSVQEEPRVQDRPHEKNKAGNQEDTDIFNNDLFDNDLYDMGLSSLRSSGLIYIGRGFLFMVIIGIMLALFREREPLFFYS